jgi:hypothetical protein
MSLKFPSVKRNGKQAINLMKSLEHHPHPSQLALFRP